MTTSGRWQDDVLRELRPTRAPENTHASESSDAVASGGDRPALPVRHPDEERPHPGRPAGTSTTGHGTASTAEQVAVPTAYPPSPSPDQDQDQHPHPHPHPHPHTPAPPAQTAPPQEPPLPASPAVDTLRAADAPLPPPPTDTSPAVRTPRQPRLPIPTPESVPALDPRLAIALGSPRHGDSLARRSGRSLRRLTSSAAQEVAEESRLGSMLQQPVTTGRVIAVTSIRGGVGKTTTAALLSRTFSHYRHDPVLALEADAALGTLPVRMGAQSVRWSCVELARILTPSMQLTDITGYLVPVADGGWLLPASQGRVGAPLDIPTYRTVTLALRRYFAVTVVDCETLPGEVARTAMDTAHARVVVAPLTAEGVGGTRIVLDWLGGLPHAALSSTVVALTSTTPDTALDLKAAAAHLRETGVTLVHMPYDRHLAGGGPIRTDRLGEATRRAAAQLAAEALQRAVRVR
ncbi:type VII secretion protein [Streptomyces sp. NPDC127063]|uniref:type VII secretion protein n=1 Tax=Streptomyces sp. NPDC127063 TaxID=3347123 RepID=UPI003656B06D